MGPHLPHLSTSWGSGKPSNPAPDAPTSTSWGSGSRRRTALLVTVAALAVASAGAAGLGHPAYAIAEASLDGAVHADAGVTTLTGLPGVSAFTAVGTPWTAGGAGTRVAVLDSGVDEVPALAGRVHQGADLTGEGFTDRYGHGTFVASLIAGNGLGAGGVQTGIRGAAPYAGIVSVKVIRDDGTATVGTLLGGLSWVLVHHTQYRIGVVNLSLSTASIESSAAGSPVDGMVEALWHAGVVVVASAGNDYGRVQRAPADDPTIITAGADYTTGVGRPELPASFSDRGTTGDGAAKPDVVAPGVHLRAALPAGSRLAGEQTTSGLPAGYGQLSGTSMSAALVSAAATDLLGADPALRPAQVKAALVGTSAGGAHTLRLQAALAARPYAAADARPTAQLYAVQRMVAAITGQSGWGLPPTVWSEQVWGRLVWPSWLWAPSTWTAAIWSDAAQVTAVWSDATWSDAVWSDVTWAESTGREPRTTSSTHQDGSRPCGI